MGTRMIHKLYLFILFIFLTSTTFGQEEKTEAQKLKDFVNKDFVAVLKKGTMVVNNKTGESYIVPQSIQIRARQRKIGGQYSDIYTLNGEKKYFTLTQNLISLEEDQKLAPKVDNLAVYDNTADIISYNKKIETLTFLDYQLSFISTKYYAEIYRGTNTSAVENQFGLKQYFSHPSIPIDFGIAASVHRGFWNDDVGTITWNSLFIGPTIHTMLWDTESGGMHLHIGALKSIYHESTFDPDTHKLSSNMLRIELSQSFRMKYGSVYLGGVFTLTQSSVKESTEYLDTKGERDNIIGVGATLGFMKPWIL